MRTKSRDTATIGERFPKSDYSLSYADWLSETGATGGMEGARYADEMQAAERRYERALPTYGSRAEALGRGGMTGSGYADYLARAAEGALEADRDEAAGAQAARENAAESAYGAYLKKREETLDKRYTSVSRRLASSGILYYDDAYRYALSEGLDEARARSAAEYGVAASLERVRTGAASYIYSRHLTADEARAYARSLGLGATDVANLAKYAEEVAKSRLSLSEMISSMTAEEYLNYLRGLQQTELFD